MTPEQYRRLMDQQKHGACEHMDMGEPLFARGMCRRCFEGFLRVSGGLFEVGEGRREGAREGG